jgi:hypothetical protein
MANMLAMRLKGGAPSGAPGGGMPAGDAGAGRGGQGQWGAGAGASGGAGRFGAPGQAAPDPQQMLNRAPAIQFKDLKKGEAIMVVSTDGAAEVNAITLLAGVEPLLEAPAASQSLLSNWSMGGNSSGGEMPQ